MFDGLRSFVGATAIALMLAPAALAATIRSGLPPAFVVDGKLDEWTSAPSVVLDASSHAAGSARAPSQDDASARAWMALAREGLAVALDVRDETVLFPTAPDAIASDHVEIWIAFPEATMPPLAFYNALTEHEVRQASDCATGMPFPRRGRTNEIDPAGCEAWWHAQVARRAKLRRAFVSQYSISPAGVARFHDAGPSPTDPSCTVAFQLTPGGYRLEALLPLSSLPRTGEAPLRHARVMLDLVDEDDGDARQDTLLSSSSSRRRFGDVATFQAVTLDPPVRYGEWSELLERAMAQRGTSCAPASDATKLQVWLNPMVWWPSGSEESPTVVDLDLAHRERIGKWGDVELVRVAAEVDVYGFVSSWLASHRGGTFVEVMPIACDEAHAAQRKSTLDVLLVTDPGKCTFGHPGPCNGCFGFEVSLVRMSSNGRFSEQRSLGELDSNGEDLTWTVAPDLSRVDYVISPDPTPGPFLSYVYNVDRDTYELVRNHDRPLN